VLACVHPFDGVAAMGHLLSGSPFEMSVHQVIAPIF